MAAPYSYAISFSRSLFIFLYTIHLIMMVNNSYSSAAPPPMCHQDENSALLQFKQSLSLNQSASYDQSAYQKTRSWKPITKGGESIDCCSWDGVECDNRTGHVIGLDLSSSFLYGPINPNSTLFSLVHLQSLNLADNHFVHSQIPPEISHLSSLSSLDLSLSVFSGQIPSELLRLSKLASLYLSDNHFSGSIPVSFGNLTHLTHLSLSSNNFNKGKLSWLGRLTKLIRLDLHHINLYGEIPSSLANLTQLNHLNFRSNNFSGEIPLWMMNMTQLTFISLSNNLLQGPISSSFSQLKNLVSLDLQANNLSGMVQADIFLNLKQLTVLRLSSNNITFLTHHHINSTLPQFRDLELGFCNISEIPYFLRFQNQLEILILEGNKFQGKIPHWIWNISAETLGTIQLDNNLLTGFEQNQEVLSGGALGFLDISNNMLQGNLPVPPPNIIAYVASNNTLTGEISPLICRASSLEILDLSNNSLSGAIPRCSSKFSNSLTALNLKGNKFSGTVPQSYFKECNLKVMYLSQNQLEGKLPRSLKNCKMLQILDIADNQMEDSFPFWLGSLPQLQVLILRSNKFNGPMGSPRITTDFPMLHIIDLSNNSFTGDLPLEYIQNWKSMKIVHMDHLTYMQTDVSFLLENQDWTQYWDFLYPNSITITNKGVKREYVKIVKIFTVVDLSSNKFIGEIPVSFGSLKGLQSLNLSNNHLTGPIPPSLGSLTELESLDLSQNKLTGVIPQQLAQELNFLAFLNVSYNLLSGPIPQGGQFFTFQNNSYEGNSALCGVPLSRNCGTVRSPIPPPADDDGSDEFPSGVDWVFIFAGFGSGLVVGLVIGNILTERYREWFVERFGRRKKQIIWS